MRKQFVSPPGRVGPHKSGLTKVAPAATRSGTKSPTKTAKIPSRATTDTSGSVTRKVRASGKGSPTLPAATPKGSSIKKKDQAVSKGKVPKAAESTAEKLAKSKAPAKKPAAPPAKASAKKK